MPSALEYQDAIQSLMNRHSKSFYPQNVDHHSPWLNRPSFDVLPHGSNLLQRYNDRYVSNTISDTGGGFRNYEPRSFRRTEAFDNQGLIASSISSSSSAPPATAPPASSPPASAPPAPKTAPKATPASSPKASPPSSPKASPVATPTLVPTPLPPVPYASATLAPATSSTTSAPSGSSTSSTPSTLIPAASALPIVTPVFGSSSSTITGPATRPSSPFLPASSPTAKTQHTPVKSAAPSTGSSSVVTSPSTGSVIEFNGVSYSSQNKAWTALGYSKSPPSWWTYATIGVPTIGTSKDKSVTFTFTKTK